MLVVVVVLVGVVWKLRKVGGALEVDFAGGLEW